jgi:hypothetical protein
MCRSDENNTAYDTEGYRSDFSIEVSGQINYKELKTAL